MDQISVIWVTRNDLPRTIDLIHHPDFGIRIPTAYSWRNHDCPMSFHRVRLANTRGAIHYQSLINSLTGPAH